MRTPEQEEIVATLDKLLLSVLYLRRNLIGNEGRIRLNRAWTKRGKNPPSDEEAEYFLALTYPWLFGKSSILIALEKIMSRCDRGGLPTATEAYNILTVIERLDDTSIILFAYEFVLMKEKKRQSFPDWSFAYLLQHLPLTTGSQEEAIEEGQFHE